MDLWASKEAVKWFARDWSLLLQPVNSGLRRTTHVFGTHFNVVLFIYLLSIVLCETDESLWLLCFYITTKLGFFFFSPTHKPFIVSSSDINRAQCSSIFPWVDYCINSFIMIAVKNYYSSVCIRPAIITSIPTYLIQTKWKNRGGGGGSGWVGWVGGWPTDFHFPIGYFPFLYFISTEPSNPIYWEATFMCTPWFSPYFSFPRTHTHTRWDCLTNQ